MFCMQLPLYAEVREPNCAESFRAGKCDLLKATTNIGPGES